MDAINCVIAVPLVTIALFFVFTGWRRGIRFNFHDYQGNQRERLRDNFFSSFTMLTAFSAVLPIFFPANLWGFAIPFIFLSILVLTPLAMLMASWSSFLARLMTRGRIRDGGAFGQNRKDLSTLEWYEFTPFAFVAGWVGYYLVYILLLLVLGIKLMSDVTPTWVVIVGLVVGVITAVLLTIGIHRKFEDR
jgi:hypothetical protein